MKKLLSLACVLIVSIGCVNVPTTKIKYGKLTIIAPKDTTIEGLGIVQTTNGVQVVLNKYSARMNPDVIQQTALGQASLVHATAVSTGEALGALLQKYIAAQSGNVGGLLPAIPQPTIPQIGTTNAPPPPN